MLLWTFSIKLHFYTILINKLSCVDGLNLSCFTSCFHNSSSTDDNPITQSNENQCKQNSNSEPNQTSTNPLGPGLSQSSTVNCTQSSQSSSSKRALVLDIDVRETNDYGEHKEDNKKHTFTATTGNGISQVKQDKTQIWKAKDKTEYSDKVEYDEGNSTLTVYLPNNKKKEYTKSGEKWTEKTQSSGTQSRDQSKTGKAKAT